MINEIWKDVKGYEGLYQVSDFGRVKSLRRNIILKGGITCKGYRGYVFYKDKNNKKTVYAHKLVAIMFLNHKPAGHKNVVNHINHNKTDNRLENLEVISQRENCHHEKIKGTSKYRGVSWDKVNKKWKAQIHHKGKGVNLGRYNTELEAHNAYQKELNRITLVY